MKDHISSLQDQVHQLWAALNELRSRSDSAYPAIPQDSIFPPDSHGRQMSFSSSRTLPPISSDRSIQKILPSFHGPTSSAYGFDVAKSSLQTMGITNNMAEDGQISRDRSRATSPTPPQMQPHPNKDPLWLIDHAEVIRLCHVYEEEIGIMYPVVETEKVIKHANSLYRFINASLRSGFGQPGLPGADTFDDDETIILKMILATTLIVEGNGSSELGQRFFDSTRPAVDLRLVTALDVKSVVLLVLTVRNADVPSSLSRC